MIALVDYAVKLTRAPEQTSPADLVPMRAVGLSDLQILTTAVRVG